MKKLLIPLIALFFETLCSGINLEPNSVVQYKLNDSAATVTVIDAREGHNGVLVDTSGDINTDTVSTTGKINGAFDLDGSDEYVYILDHADFDFANKLSISGWIRLDTLDSSQVIVAHDNGTSRNYAVYIDGYNLVDFYKFTSNTPSVLVSDTVLSAETWYHVVVTYSSETVSKASLDTYKRINGPGISNPVIATGANGESDDNIREIGNVLHEPNDDTEKYKIFYTGYDIASGTDEKLHYAYSTDGITWTKGDSNPVIVGRAEDPYVVEDGGTYYLFAEDKAGGGTEIKRWNLTDCNSDCNSWSDDGVVFSPNASGWDSWGVSSPVVWIEDSTWYMLYEGSDTSFSVAEIGLATSADGSTWTRSGSNPVFTPLDSWAVDSIVPDDIVKIGSVYYLVYHGMDSGSVYFTLQATSTNLTTWSDYSENQIFDDAGHSRGAQVFYDDSEYVFYYSGADDTYGIYKGYPYTEYGNMCVYLNGTLDSSKVVALGAIDTDNVHLAIGARYGNDRNLDGLIDNVMLFNKELSQEEVTFLYNNGDGRETLSAEIVGRALRARYENDYRNRY